MIVTFQVAVYLLYYFWNTYVSQHLSGNQETQDNNSRPQSKDENQPPDEPKPSVPNDNKKQSNDIKTEDGEGGTSDTKSPENDQSEPNQQSGPEDETKDENNTPAKEGEGDHPCLPQVDEDRGRDMIYNVEPEFSCICTDEKVQFIPPVFIQRYMEIERVLKEPQWAKTVKKVVNFGCAELSFEARYLKKLEGIEEIIAVDIDANTLECHACKVSPYPSDFLNKRSTPLTVRVFHGSVAHTHDVLIGSDAVIAIELIEHLFPPELDNLPFTIFGFIKPKLAMFTTPNSDFNVLFKNLTGFRHLDHKFEWSQQQFEDWARNLVLRYPDYQVMFKGIGPGPPGKEDLGCCSQMATFIKVNDSPPIPNDEIHVQDGPYSVIAENVFPFYKDERTEEEKIRDEAEYFITSCIMRKRVYDEVKTELPLKSVMERVGCHDQEKLKKLLLAKNLEVKVNSTGEEVIIFPDSEEENDSETDTYGCVTTNNYQNCDSGYVANAQEVEENWDVVDCDNADVTLTDSIHDPCLVDHDSLGKKSNENSACMSDKSYHSEDIPSTKPDFVYGTDTEKLINSEKLSCSLSKKCSTPATSVPDLELCDRLSSSNVESIPEKDTNLNFEKSIYETPKNDDLYCDSCVYSLPSSDQTTKDCKKALIMESTKELEAEIIPQSEDQLCCLSSVSSSCDTSMYATPCCSKRHKNNIPKCLSLQQINSCCDLNGETKLEEGKLGSDQVDRFSKSMEGIKCLENDLTHSSTSKIFDSGYPDSYSECNMDMDLTPEQFDDIETEGEENDASSRSVSPPPLPPQIPWLVDDVQNGDVANNNRDGEGNNLVADMDEEPLEFEARIDEVNNDVLNLAPAVGAINVDHDMKPDEPLGMDDDHLSFEEKIEVNGDLNFIPANDSMDFDHDMLSKPSAKDINEESLGFESKIEVNNEVSNLAPVNDSEDFDHDMKSDEPSAQDVNEEPLRLETNIEVNNEVLNLVPANDSIESDHDLKSDEILAQDVHEEPLRLETNIEVNNEVLNLVPANDSIESDHDLKSDGPSGQDVNEEPLSLETNIEVNNEVLNLVPANDSIESDHDLKSDEPSGQDVNEEPLSLETNIEVNNEVMNLVPANDSVESDHDLKSDEPSGQDVNEEPLSLETNIEVNNEVMNLVPANDSVESDHDLKSDEPSAEDVNEEPLRLETNFELNNVVSNLVPANDSEDFDHDLKSDEPSAQDMNEELLRFETKIEVKNEVLNLAPVNDSDDFDHHLKSDEHSQTKCGDCLTVVSDIPSMTEITGDQITPEMSPNHDWSKLKSVFTEINIDNLSDTADKQSLRSTKSDISITTNSSFSLDPYEGQSNSKSEGTSVRHRVHSPRLKTHNSLTTVLDGRSKFSNCSLVRPVDVYLVSGIEIDSINGKTLPGGSRETNQQEAPSTSDTYAVASTTSTSLENEQRSLLSVYQSAESLNIQREPLIEPNENSAFPEWLLRILATEFDENEVDSVDSLQSVWDSDSLEERMELNYDVQVDSRGGGDPQRDSWH